MRHMLLLVRRKLHCDVLKISTEVLEALHNKEAVVALESTIITHGMPYPHNLTTALSVERVIREQGAVPATVAVLKGKLHVGLTAKELEHVASGASSAVKTSCRDLPYVLSQGVTGGTTVSATMVAAHKAGIAVFVTGGIGGVHRGAESSMDISADLTELGRTPVAVVSAGVKSILDIGRTLEYLETQGVCVASYGPSKEFPAFFIARSGFPAPYNVNTAYQAAQLIDTSLQLGRASGVLIAVPVPGQYAADGKSIETAVQTALLETQEKGVSGKDVTPYILQRVSKLTDGKSLLANIALIKNNAKVGAQIAMELAVLRNQNREVLQRTMKVTKSSPSEVQYATGNRSVVIGGTNVDFTATFDVDNVQTNGGTYPGSVQQSLGGVGRNLADCLSRLGHPPLLLSAVGNDSHGSTFLQQCTHMDTSGIARHTGLPTATYCALMSQSKELMFGIGDFQVHSEITPQYLSQYKDSITDAQMVCIDGNIPSQSMKYVCDICHANSVPVWFEPADVQLAHKVFQTDAWQKLTYTSPNLTELRVLHNSVVGSDQQTLGASPVEMSKEEIIEEVVHLMKPVIQHIPVLVVTLGKHGVLLCQRSSSMSEHLPIKGHHLTIAGQVSVVHYPAEDAERPKPIKVSVSGAGDCLAAAVIACTLGGGTTEQSIKCGLLVAEMSLSSHQAVPSTVSPWLLSADAVSRWRCTPRTIL